MKIENDFDREKMEIIVNVQCNLLKKYYPNFVGILEKNKKDIPNGFKVIQSSSNSAKISFPIPEGTTIVGEGGGSFAVNLTSLINVINQFAGSALQYELSHTEFIPINGYPLENLKEDIRTSVKNKRNLCVLGEYEEYLNMESQHKYQFHQVYLNYGTSEWADLVLMILSSDMEEIRKLYTPKLEFTEWY
jgi:hypothetical protein